jgi:hypothetical protein
MKEYLLRPIYKRYVPRNPKHDDIFIVEFPKSGITWLSNIIGNIELLLNNKKENITYYNVVKYIPDIHQVRNAPINRFSDRTFIKSHLKYNRRGKFLDKILSKV